MHFPFFLSCFHSLFHFIFYFLVHLYPFRVGPYSSFHLLHFLFFHISIIPFLERNSLLFCTVRFCPVRFVNIIMGDVHDHPTLCTRVTSFFFEWAPILNFPREFNVDVGCLVIGCLRLGFKTT
jgi:hypothetical protein